MEWILEGSRGEGLGSACILVVLSLDSGSEAMLKALIGSLVCEMNISF